MSEASARANRFVKKLRLAELLATLVSLKYSDFMRRRLYEAMKREQIQARSVTNFCTNGGQTLGSYEDFPRELPEWRCSVSQARLGRSFRF